MTAFELIQAILVFIMLAVAIWFCSRSPLWLAKFIDKEVIGNTDVSSYYRPNREFIAYIREHPESWHLRYPRVLRAIRLTGWLAIHNSCGKPLDDIPGKHWRGEGVSVN